MSHNRMGDQPDNAMPEIPRKGTPYDAEPCANCGHLGEEHIEEVDYICDEVIDDDVECVYLTECDEIDCICEQYIPPDTNK